MSCTNVRWILWMLIGYFVNWVVCICLGNIMLFFRGCISSLLSAMGRFFFFNLFHHRLNYLSSFYSDISVPIRINRNTRVHTQKKNNQLFITGSINGQTLSFTNLPFSVHNYLSHGKRFFLTYFLFHQGKVSSYNFCHTKASFVVTISLFRCNIYY